MLQYLRSGQIAQALIYFISTLFVVFLILPVHEYAHAFAANRLGDNTARHQGRLSFNPLNHIDWMGAVMILLVGFGWAKPVQVNTMAFKNPKRDMALTAFAGPLSNFLFAFVSLFLYNAVYSIIYVTGLGFLQYILLFFIFIARINIGLAVFNLIPVPPLDGSKILFAFLPDRIYYQIMRYERFLMIAVIVLVFSRALSHPLGLIINGVYNFFDFVTAIPFWAIIK